MKKSRVVLTMSLLCALLQPWALRAADDDDDEAMLDTQIELYSRKITANPKDTKSLMARGMAYNDNGEYGEAVNDFIQVCQLEPKNFQAFLLCGEALSSAEDYDMAILTYSQAIQLNAKSADAYVGRADARAANGEYQLAVDDYSCAIKLKNSIDYVRARGWAYVQLEKYLDAIADFNEVVQKVGDEDGGVCYCERGEARLGAGWLEEALADLDKGLSLAVQATGLPEHEVADNCHFLRAKVYIAQKDYKKALAAFNVAIKQNGNLHEYYAERAKAYAALGQPAQAKKDEAQAKSMKRK
ncbi:MAG: tetratricopeptide repeat protein [Prevotellaceae bacterium]|nr:tetratricopeptide repeat protein [Prevotellaceae bacterium]